MKSVACSLSAFALIACSTPPVPPPASLVGTWKVDLRPTPGAAPYFQDFVVTEVDGKSFTGRFYGSPIEHGRINDDWGRLRIAFVTTDGSGPYNHSAVLAEGKLEGQTHSIGRGFLAYWSATR